MWLLENVNDFASENLKRLQLQLTLNELFTKTN